MKSKINQKNLNTLYLFIRYNLKTIFANKFIYFLLAALILFLLITIINLFDSDSSFDSGAIYWLLIFPGMLLIFYPTAFGIQNDNDSRMLEMIFGIPNYRYKVHLIRLLLTMIATVCVLLILAFISSITLTAFPIFSMIFQLFFPLLFLATLAFMFSTLVRNGNATAVIIVIIGIIFLFSQDFLGQSRWNLFHNPFTIPNNSNDYIWADTTFYNRLYLVIGSIIAILFGLRNLQKREWFV